jgi:single-stranded-DNA-specific exonuclease
MTSILNINASVLQTKWVLPSIRDEDVQDIIRHHDLPEIIARLLTARGITKDDAQEFLNPTLAKHFPNPFALKDMNECANFVADQIPSWTVIEKIVRSDDCGQLGNFQYPVSALVAQKL